MIKLTNTAIERINTNLKTHSNAVGIILTVKTTGCSGMAYVMEYATDMPDSKHTLAYNENNLKIWITETHREILKDLTLDWQRQGINEGFVFNNPQESARCGCGESFTI